MDKISHNINDNDDKVFKRTGPIEIESIGHSWHQIIEYQYYWSIHFDDVMPTIVLN